MAKQKRDKRVHGTHEDELVAQHRMSSRELRERMKHDPLVDTINFLKDFWNRWKNISFWVLVGLVLVVAVLMGLVHQNRKHVEEAFNTLARAEERIQQLPSKPEDQKATEAQTILDSLETIIRNYGDTRAAPVARLKRAALLVEQANYSEAKREYEAVIRSEKKNLLHSMARIGLAGALAGLNAEQGGGLDAAIKEYSAYLADFPDSDFQDQVLYQMGKILEIAGRDTEALAAYSQIGEKSPFHGDAKERIEYLKAPVVLFDENRA